MSTSDWWSQQLQPPVQPRWLTLVKVCLTWSCALALASALIYVSVREQAKHLHTAPADTYIMD